MQVWEYYTEQMHQQFKSFATWLPSERVELGMIGRIDNGRFDFVTTLAQQQIPFTEETSGTADLEHRSGAEISVGGGGGAGADACVAGAAKGSATIKFAGSGAFVFHAKSCVVHSIADKVKLAEHIREAFKSRPEDAWDPRWVIVDNVVRSTQVVVLVSSSASATVTLAAKGDLGAGIDLAGAAAQGDLAFSYSNGDVTKITTKKNQAFTPLFRLIKLRKRYLGIFGRPGLSAVRDTGDEGYDPVPEPGTPESPFFDVAFPRGLARVTGLLPPSR